MTIPDLEAKCREALTGSFDPFEPDPKLILRLIEERRLLARFIEASPSDLSEDEVLRSLGVLECVQEEAAECKST